MSGSPEGTSEAPDSRDVLFKELDPDNAEDVTEIESLCFGCYKQGTTRLLLTKIPFFREVVLSSFSCDECGYSDTGIQSGGRIQDRGVKYTLTVTSKQDLNRQLVRSDAATFAIPHLEFEQPPSKKGEVSTVEGMIEHVIKDLEMFQPQRQAADPDTAEKVEAFLVKLRALLNLEGAPFKVVLDDPTGNSYIENPSAPKRDVSLEESHYVRSRPQDEALGLLNEEGGAASEEQDQTDEKTSKTSQEEPEDLNAEVLTFNTNCPDCNCLCETNMKMVQIPFFKEAVIMATTCEACGFRDNEVKGGAGFEEKGVRIKLHLTDVSDLSRDVLKSDTCGLTVPELELELMPGTLGGRFTTVEGLLDQVTDQLRQKNPFFVGDSTGDETKSKISALCDKLAKVAKGEMLGVHLILDDPAGNSYLQNTYAPDPDPEMEVVKYTRTEEQDEELGLKDMKTENYEAPAKDGS